MGLAIEHQVLVDLVADQVDVAPRMSAANRSSSAREIRAPLGLCGLLRIIIRVRSLSASVMRCQSMAKPGRARGTCTQRPPASSTEGS